jgi:photosystem II stability/assembly factor-like uncharacterized protein
MNGKIPMLTAAIGVVLYFAVNPTDAQIWALAGASTNSWRSIACSADGTRWVAGSGTLGTSDRSIYISTNSGATWTQTSAPSNFWFSVASSADGTRLVAAVGYSAPGPIYTSMDSGATWISNSAPIANWFSVASSADGTKLAAAALGSAGGIYTSTNSGADWTSNSLPALSWRSVACSADGTKMVAAAYGPTGGIYTSTNSGTTWTEVSNHNLLLTAGRAVACSADGTRLAVLVGLQGGPPSFICISTNSGTTWLTNSVSVQLGQTTGASVAMSADGTKIIAVAGYIYTSTNSGTSWQTNNLPEEGWGCVATSVDGNRLMVVSAGASGGPGHIYNTYATSSPSLGIASAGNDLVLSWTVPSTNFVLQQNQDLSTTNWTPLTDQPVLNLTNLQNQMFLSSNGSNNFYRLATP